MGGNLRILFAFDPRRMAILLIGATRPIGGMFGIESSSRLPTLSTMSI